MANEYLTGGLGGAMSGAGAGFSIGGPVGAGIGAGVGFIGGLMQGDQQRRRTQDYNKAEQMVQPVDPQQTAFLDRLRRQEQYYRAGTDPSSGFAMQNQRNALAQTQANINRAGGGINQLLRAQQNANMGMAQVGAGAARMADPMLMAQGNLTSMIAQRKHDYYQRQRDVAMGRMEQGRQDLMNVFMGGLATLPQMAGAFKNVPGQAPSAARMTQQINASLPAGRAMSYATPNTPGMGIGVLNPNQFSFNQQPAQAPAWWGGQQAPAWWQ